MSDDGFIRHCNRCERKYKKNFDLIEFSKCVDRYKIKDGICMSQLEEKISGVRSLIAVIDDGMNKEISVLTVPKEDFDALARVAFKYREMFYGECHQPSASEMYDCDEEAMEEWGKVPLTGLREG